MFYSSEFESHCPLNYRIASAKLSDDINVVEIGYNRTPKGMSRVMKRDIYILHYVTNGKGEFCGKKFTKNNGYLVVPNELETMVTDAQDPYDAYWIMFKGEKAAEILEKCNLPCHNGVFEFNKTDECSKILHHALFNIVPENDLEEAALMHAAFYQIISLHFNNVQPAVSVNGTAKKIKRLINENYYNDISIDSIAKRLNYSRNYLYTLFKNNYGISPQSYLLNLRIQKAKELLTKERDLPISEIARATGYKDPLYFSRVFHKKTGVTPLEYKNSTGPNAERSKNHKS